MRWLKTIVPRTASFLILRRALDLHDAAFLGLAADYRQTCGKRREAGEFRPRGMWGPGSRVSDRRLRRHKIETGRGAGSRISRILRQVKWTCNKLQRRRTKEKVQDWGAGGEKCASIVAYDFWRAGRSEAPRLGCFPTRSASRRVFVLLVLPMHCVPTQREVDATFAACIRQGWSKQRAIGSIPSRHPSCP